MSACLGTSEIRSLYNQDSGELGALGAPPFHSEPLTATSHSLAAELGSIYYVLDTVLGSSWSFRSSSSKVAFPVISLSFSYSDDLKALLLTLPSGRTLPSCWQRLDLPLWLWHLDTLLG